MDRVIAKNCISEVIFGNNKKVAVQRRLLSSKHPLPKINLIELGFTTRLIYPEISEGHSFTGMLQ